jgi:hypothetical protein
MGYLDEKGYLVEKEASHHTYPYPDPGGCFCEICHQYEGNDWKKGMLSYEDADWYFSDWT